MEVNQDDIKNSTIFNSTCLGFINITSNMWNCQDRDLTILNYSRITNSKFNITNIKVCGYTNHFTDFAILVSSNSNNSTNINLIFSKKKHLRNQII